MWPIDREMREMNLPRSEEFAGRLQSKDEEIDKLKDKYTKIKGDFGYNLKLLEAAPRPQSLHRSWCRGLSDFRGFAGARR